MLQRIKAFVRDSKAVSALEYAILVGVIAVAIAVTLNTFSGNINEAITDIGVKIKDPANTEVIDLDG